MRDADQKVLGLKIEMLSRADYVDVSDWLHIVGRLLLIGPARIVVEVIEVF